MFPLIFPFGIGLIFFLARIAFAVLSVLVVIALVYFIIQTIRLGSPQAALDSMLGMGNSWRFKSQYQQPYYQPQQRYDQPYYQPQQPQQPPYQSQQEQPYGYYQPQSRPQQEMPPMEQ
ncbi:MAG TPA: hypothetical protein VFA41_02700 [Ktedonobacteraceae bacterium]|jgi:hypothetical protein|nr:hypothetical protein [Ktedonobacteraceae bacterium]